MKYLFDYSLAKDEILRQARGISFEDVIKAIDEGGLIDNIDHFNNEEYPHQMIFVVKVLNYIYAVPYVLDHKRKVIFLKTIYPSRKLREIYHEKR